MAGRVLVERAPYDMLRLTGTGRLEQFIVQTQDYVDALRAGEQPPSAAPTAARRCSSSKRATARARRGSRSAWGAATIDTARALGNDGRLQT